MKKLLSLLKRNTTETPVMDELLSALLRICDDKDFKLFRAYLRSTYCDSADALTSVEPGNVDFIRGRMSILAELDKLMERKSIEALQSDLKEKADLEEQVNITREELW